VTEAAVPPRAGPQPAHPGGRAPGKAALGLVVNPVAGIGGRVGLKGSDGAGTVERALALGAAPEAGRRTVEALVRLRAAWPARRPFPRVLAAPGEMGERAAREAGLEPEVVGAIRPGRTTAEDTRRLAAAIVERGADLLLVAGGDGTARDVHDALGGRGTVLGIPAGVKIQSAVFATGPAAAGELAAEFLAAERPRTAEREVLDLDEDAYRDGRVAPRLYGTLRVPAGRLVQGRKSPSPPEDAATMAGIAADLAERLVPGRRYVLGPGTTVRAIAERLGVPKTLVGVDVVLAEEWGRATLLAADVGERELLATFAGGPASIVVTPIGGQGFVLGRGNQPISPAVVRAVGREHIIIVATAAKLAALGGRPLVVDSGDPALDAALAGYVTVLTGYRDAAVVRLEAA
jgi:predicted polyphosphate/ATP-dependent NAD kinase